MNTSFNAWSNLDIGDGIGDLKFLSTEIMEQFRPSGKMFVQELQETFTYIRFYLVRPRGMEEDNSPASITFSVVVPNPFRKFYLFIKPRISKSLVVNWGSLFENLLR